MRTPQTTVPTSRAVAPGTAADHQPNGASPNHAATVQSLQRTWQAGAGQVIVTFGATGNQWDIEQSTQRVIPQS